MDKTDRAKMLKGWAVILLKDELTGQLSYEFTFPVGDGTKRSLELGTELSLSEMRRKLGRHTTSVPDLEYIQKLLDAAPTQFVVKARQPGWKPSSATSHG